jgi:hypothetical protein
MKTVLPLLAVLVATLALACDDDNGDGAPTEQTAVDVQARAVTAFDALESSLVRATGTVEQDGERIEFANDYIAVAPDRLSYNASSTHDGEESTIELISIGAETWTLEDGSWVPFPASGDALRVFTGRRLWELVPFDSARPAGDEPIGEVTARRYDATRDITLGFAELAGTLIASDVQLDGEIQRVDVSYWVDPATGRPLRAEYHATGDGTLDVTVTLERADDAALTVDPPPGVERTVTP